MLLGDCCQEDVCSDEQESLIGKGGLRQAESSSIRWSQDFFNNGLIIACLKAVGTMPLLHEMLKFCENRNNLIDQLLQ